MKKLITYVLSDAEQLYGTHHKIRAMLKEQGFYMSDKIIALGSEFFINHTTGQEVAIVSIPKDKREDYYKSWVDNDEKIVAGKNIRYLLKEDFDDWANARGEWV